MQARTITTAFAAYSQVVSTGACQLIALQGYYAGADAWLQIHDAAALPSNTAVPLKSFALPATLAYSWKFDPTPLVLKTGLVVCVSTTEGTLTLAAGGNTADFEVEIEESRILPVVAVSTAGDLTTGTDALEVWNDAAGPKYLMNLTVINNEAFTVFPLLYAKDAPANHNKCLITLAPIATLTTKKYFFGDTGITLFQQVSAEQDHDGCSVALSSTGVSLTNDAMTSVCCIKAEYHA